MNLLIYIAVAAVGGTLVAALELPLLVAALLGVIAGLALSVTIGGPFES